MTEKRGQKTEKCKTLSLVCHIEFFTAVPNNNKNHVFLMHEAEAEASEAK
jgi:hypothetical protein